MSNTAHIPSACKPLDGALQIPLTMLTPSPLNPRKSWAPARITRMADSLRASGQVQPIRVRPNPEFTGDNGRPPYEIVVGETRYRAAPEAGLQMLDAVVGQYTDQQVIELALAENTQRRDLHPLEEADAYAALLRTPTGLQGYATVPELAAAVGASESHVYQRLKLRNLCDAGREAFLAGKFDAGVALLIARMPDASEQATATADILAGWGGEPYSYRQAAAHLKRKFMLSLYTATFDTAATYKVAGPCRGCPKRSSAAPGLFEDVTGGDHCQDSRCFQAKVAEAHQALLDRAEEEGHEVVTGGAARAVLPVLDGEPAAGYYMMSRPCPSLTDSTKPLRDLLPKATTKMVIIEHPKAPGQLLQLVTHAVAMAGLKKRGLLRRAPDAVGAGAERAATQTLRPPNALAFVPPPPPPAPARAGGKGGDKVDMAEQIGISRRFCADVFAQLHSAVTTAPVVRTEALRRVVLHLVDGLSFEALQLLYWGYGWEQPENFIGEIDARIANASARMLGDLMVLCLTLEELTTLHMSPTGLRQLNSSHTLALADEYDVNVGVIWYEAQAPDGKSPEPAPGPARRDQTADDATAAWLDAQP